MPGVPTISPLPAGQLRWRVPEGVLGFRTTQEVDPTDEIIGQAGALAALERGVRMEAPGFNVFVVGLLSTGRLGTVQRVLERLAPPRRVTRDFVYVANFKDPSRPRLLEFEAGRGVAFRKELLRTLAFLMDEVPRLLRSQEVRDQRTRRTRDAEVAHHGALQRVESHAKDLGFLVGDVGEEGNPTPVILWVDPAAGTPDEPVVLTRAELEVRLANGGGLALSKDLLERFDDLERELAAALDASHEVVMDTVRVVAEAERTVIGSAAKKALARLGRRWRGARGWLAELLEELCESVEWFDEEGDQESLIAAFTANVVHRGGRSAGAPVVLVPHPTWTNLFGGIEGEGALDHRAVRGGNLQDADGGFLVLNATDLLQDANAWRLLKRTLMFGQVEIQNAESPLATGNAVLRPETMRLDVKVVLLGDIASYAALFYGDPDFRSLFKIKAEFEEDAPIAVDLLRQYVGFVARVARKEKLPALDADAVAAVLEWAVRAAGRGGRITTRFGEIADLVREAAFEARGGPVGRPHVDRALEARRHRDDLAERRVVEMFRSGMFRIDVSGSRVGQVNALVVYHVGGHDFGRPMRITATAGAGRGGAVSIEREVGLSGKLHDKGVQILRGFLLDRFGRDRPLSFSANLCFEQSYARVDGDSATLGEACALLSALGQLPLRQDVAVTGSVNQFGEIQPVGGVNEKIEGFWTACTELGVTGTQGVVLPIQNVKDLHLSAEVVAACEAGRFHVWAVSSLDEGMAVLSGLDPGVRGADGTWSDGVSGRVEAALLRLHGAGQRRRTQSQETEET